MLLSLITINFNNDAGLERTIKSVQSQETSFSVEHILIDGASTDRSIDIITEYKSIANEIITLSEKDKGIYDAMNKGLAIASGTHIAFLNSGDVLAHNKVLNDVCSTIERDKSIDLLYGDICFINEEGLLTRKWSAGNYQKYKLYFGWMPPHPMATIRKDTLGGQINFNEKIKIAADYDLMLKILLQPNCVVKYLPDTLVMMELGGVSNSSLYGVIKSNLEVVKSWIAIKGCMAPYWIFFTKPLTKISQITTRKFR